MEMIQSLGINSSAFIQFGIFAVVFFTLRNLVFIPYHEALLERQSRTKGGEDLASEFADKTAALELKYQEEARKVHSEITAIYQQNKNEAQAEYERVIAQTRNETQKLLESSRASIAQAVASASQNLRNETSIMAMSITNKLLGK